MNQRSVLGDVTPPLHNFNSSSQNRPRTGHPKEVEKKSSSLFHLSLERATTSRVLKQDAFSLNSTMYTSSLSKEKTQQKLIQDCDFLPP